MTFKADRKRQKPQENGEKLFTISTAIIYAGLTIFAIGIILQMSRWQIINGEYFKALAQSQYIDSDRQASARGMIYASDDTILATDQPSWDIYISLSTIENERTEFFAEKDKFVAAVAGILQLDKESVSEKITDDIRFVPIAKDVDTQTKKALEETQIFTKKSPGFGLYFIQGEKRVYPNGTLASHILGFMGQDENGEEKGVYGIEGYYYGDLIGAEGFTYEEKDALGNVILTSEYEPVLPRRGKDIKLTIVPSIQTKVEEVLKEGVTKYQAKSGSTIVMDPTTGAILAIANYPNYNPNEYWRTQEPWIFSNKAVSDVYEPGSIFKPITVAIGLETGSITPETVCDDLTGYFTMYEGRTDEVKIRTWDAMPDGSITPEQYLQYSNNPCIAQTALKVGLEKYYPLMTQFGIGEYIGLGLQEESNSYLKPQKDWIELDLAVTSFGQSVASSPMQMISALSTIANHGVRMKPYLVSSVIDEDETIEFEPQQIANPISAETADTVAAMLRSVVRKGDGSAIFAQYLPDYDVAGKTGTAQIPYKDRAGYYDDRINTTFVGFAPVDDPHMIMLIRLEEPGLGQYAATTVVPVWIDTFNKIAGDLQIPKQIVPN